MPVEAGTSEFTYTGDGVTTTFPFPSRFFSNDDLSVGVNNVEQDPSTYTVTGAGSATGGSVIFNVAPAVGAGVLLLRKPEASQLVDFVNGQTILEGTLDNALDRLTMLIQYVLRKDEGVVRISDFDTQALMRLPLATARASKLFGFDADGKPIALNPNPVENGFSTIDAIIDATTVGKAVVRAATQEAARAAMGLVTSSDIENAAVTVAKLALGAWTSIASAATVDLGALASRNIVITGTTTITSFGSTATPDNQPFHVRFAGAATITRSASLETPGGVSITTAANDSAIVVQETAGNWRIVAYQRATATGTPGALYGLTTAYVSATTYSVAAGSATSEDGSAYPMVLGSAMTKSLSAWAAGSGAGSLDTGTIAASTWYHVHLIYNPVTAVADLLLSLSPTAPTLPSGYVGRRRLGSVKTNASSQLVAWVQRGDGFLWSVPVVDYRSTYNPAAARGVDLSVPTGIQVDADIVIACISITTTFALLVTSFDQADTAPNVYVGSQTPTIPWTMEVPYGIPAYSTVSKRVRTSTTGTIRLRASVDTGSDGYVSIMTDGWIDTRGRN